MGRTRRSVTILRSSPRTWAKWMLEVAGLSAWYGQAQALKKVPFRVDDGELIPAVGRNGAGKTTTLRCLVGLHREMEGRIVLGGEEISGWSPERRARAGLGFVPDDRGIYATLTVDENLTLPPQVGPTAWPLDRIYATFPVLRERRRLRGRERRWRCVGRAHQAH